MGCSFAGVTLDILFLLFFFPLGSLLLCWLQCWHITWLGSQQWCQLTILPSRPSLRSAHPSLWTCWQNPTHITLCGHSWVSMIWKASDFSITSTFVHPLLLDKSYLWSWSHWQLAVGVFCLVNQSIWKRLCISCFLFLLLLVDILCYSVWLTYRSIKTVQVLWMVWAVWERARQNRLDWEELSRPWRPFVVEIGYLLLFLSHIARIDSRGIDQKFGNWQYLHLLTVTWMDLDREFFLCSVPQAGLCQIFYSLQIILIQGTR